MACVWPQVYVVLKEDCYVTSSTAKKQHVPVHRMYLADHKYVGQYNPTSDNLPERDGEK